MSTSGADEWCKSATTKDSSQEQGRWSTSSSSFGSRREPYEQDAIIDFVAAKVLRGLAKNYVAKGGNSVCVKTAVLLASGACSSYDDKPLIGGSGELFRKSDRVTRGDKFSSVRMRNCLVAAVCTAAGYLNNRVNVALQWESVGQLMIYLNTGKIRDGITFENRSCNFVTYFGVEV